MQLLLVLLAALQTAESSSIFLDWTTEVPNGGVRAYVLDYSPPVGIPPAGTHLSRTTQQILLNQTIPAADYSIYLTALMTDGSRKNVSEKHLPSSPQPPILDSIETSASDATISYFPPQGSDISYYIEYFPVDREEYANFVETKASLVKLRGLDPATTFRLRILSVFRGVPSTESIDTTFLTKEFSSSEELSLFSVKTLPPDLDLAVVTLPTIKITLDGSKEYEYASSKEDYSQAQTNSPQDPTQLEYYYQETITPETVLSPSTSAPSTMTESAMPFSILSTVPDTTVLPMQSSTSNTAYITQELQSSYETAPATKIQMKVTRKSSTSTTTTTITTTTTTAASTSTTQHVDTDYNEETSASNELSTSAMRQSTESPIAEPNALNAELTTGHTAVHNLSVPSSENFEGYGEPSDVWLSKEGKMLKLEWEVEENALCDAFLVNYTVLSLSQPKTFSVATQETFALIKMFTDHIIDLKVFCMLAGALSKTWWAHRVADLSKPRAIEGLTVSKVETDDFYVASIEIGWEWPARHDFEHYEVVVSYGIGNAPPKTMQVIERDKVLLDKLEPTQEYTITVRNISKELEIASTDASLKQLTPPIISSTLYPGQISSTSININFGESDPEQGRFEHYELEFTGNNKNISRKIGMDKDRSFTFTKLIPGKTYHFSLYTVYHGMRSRPVTADVTTYPLKVDKLRPVIGKDYAVLYWDIENFADNDVRFRLSYIATANNGARKERTVQLKNQNSYRFDELDLETYYTFTITVIMGLGDAEAESESEMVTVAFGKDYRSRPSLKRHGTRELALIFENDHAVWHELNGAISNFAVIVAEDIELGGDEYELRSWFEVHNDDTWGAYRASKSDYNPFKKRGTKEATFIIGEDDCEQQRLDEPFCNGMLRANVKYMGKLRAYTEEGIAMETEWVAIHGRTDGQPGEDDNDEEEEDPGLPCHMYLNGCPRKGAEKSGGLWQSLLSAFGFLGR